MDIGNFSLIFPMTSASSVLIFLGFPPPPFIIITIDIEYRSWCDMYVDLFNYTSYVLRRR